MSIPDKLAGVAASRDVVVIGASAGGVSALRDLVAGLPADFPAAVAVVLHLGSRRPSQLAEILDAAGPLPAVTARDGQRLNRGCIHVAPPNRHLLVAGDHLHLRRGPKENMARPAIDVLFRTAAVSCTSRVIGVVLTGMLDDGTAGLSAIKRCGGLAVVQDPADAPFPDMPRSALAQVDVDHVRPLAALPGLLAELVATAAPAPPEVPPELRAEALLAAQELDAPADQHAFGTLSPFTCPECHGSLWEVEDGGMVRYRCHTGHAYTERMLGLAQVETLEETLYDALRAQKERALLLLAMAERARRHGAPDAAADLEHRAAECDEDTRLIGLVITRVAGRVPTDPEDDDGP